MAAKNDTPPSPKSPLVVAAIGATLIILAFALGMDLWSPLLAALGVPLTVVGAVLALVRAFPGNRRVWAAAHATQAPVGSVSHPEASPSHKPPLVLAAVGAAMIAAAFALRLGAVSAFLAVLGFALVLGGGAIGLVRLFPGYQRMREAGQATEAQKRRALEEHARAGSTTQRSFSRGEVISGEHAGVRYEHYVIPGGRNVPPRPAVAVPTAAPGEFHVHPESGGTETVKALGMVDEFRSGDAALDRRLYFSGTTDEYVRAVFGVRENLDVLRALLALGFDQVEKTSKRLIASRKEGTYVGVAEVRRAVDLLLRLRLPETVAGSEGKALVGKKMLYIVRGAVAAIVMAGSIALFTVRPLVEGWSGLVATTVPMVAALTLGAVAAAYFLLRGRSMSAGGLVEILISLPLIVAGLFGTLALANQHLDASAAEEQQVKLVRYWFAHGSKGGRFYHLEFNAWRGAGTIELHNVGEEVYSLARDGQIWKLRLRRGLLGVPWVEAMAPIAP